MNKLNIILTISFLVFLLPFLGFPQTFDNFLYVIFAITIFVSAYMLKRESGISNDGTRTEENL